MGSIGEDTNNFTELEGLLRGMGGLIRGGLLPAIVEGDSNILIAVTKRLASGQTTEKISPSWRLAYRLERLRVLLRAHPALSFHHVRREANKVADCLENSRVDCGVGLRCSRLEFFTEEGWAQQCQHMAIMDLNESIRVEDHPDGGSGGTRRREHVHPQQPLCS